MATDEIACRAIWQAIFCIVATLSSGSISDDWHGLTMFCFVLVCFYSPNRSLMVSGLMIYAMDSPGNTTKVTITMSDRVTITNENFKLMLNSIESFCKIKCSLYHKKAGIEFACPLFAIEHVLMEHEPEGAVDEPVCWHVINFYDCDEIVVMKSTSDKAECIADLYGQPYELLVPGSREAAYEMVISLEEE
ncbi:hypothetical protein [Paenibacillus sp. MMS18-CY102]|uniref:hypothetical protein n=1 Tax=Paenibacillus sp. MMS18-CY102 TaxID=2682849 RepID=UPI0013659C53|nr:hypothetical protein [Paenibacillus sp. MMS18-CY102]MWC27181.1 hypothetical protein [Paenibacillus sp. MMS18-CY102]